VAACLVTKLRDPLVHERLVEFVVLIHAAEDYRRRPGTL
jgi:hypothetical protein